MEPSLLDAWRVHARINHYLLDTLDDDALSLRASERGGRTVGALFAHIHDVRLMWLKEAAPDLLEGLERFGSGAAPTVAALREALEGSAGAVEALVQRTLEAGGRVRGFKPDVATFVAYLVSHESHHRGQAVLTLRLAGRPLERKTAFGMWEWGVR